jgi:hypothetical protein
MHQRRSRGTSAKIGRMNREVKQAFEDSANLAEIRRYIAVNCRPRVDWQEVVSTLTKDKIAVLTEIVEDISAMLADGYSLEETIHYIKRNYPGGLSRE